MEEPNPTQNPEQGDFGHSDEDHDGLENRSTTDSTSETTGDSYLEPPVLDSHSSALVHINSACPTIDDLQSQNDDLRRQNRALEEEVARYQVAHLRELPEDHITDATAQRLYEGIQDAIEQWVYNVTGKSPAADWLKKYERRLRALMQEPKTSKPPPVLKSIPMLFRDSKIYRASESIDYIFLSWFIAHSLTLYVFDKRYPVGIEEDQEAFLDHAIDAMRASRSHYDEHYINKWRTQTLAILMSHRDFSKGHEDVFDMEYERMRNDLLQWLPMEDLKEHEDELKEGIFREAVMLQQKMGLAADDYKMEFKSLDSRSVPDGKVTYRNLHNFRRIDAQDICQIYGCLFPSLYHIDFRGKSHYITGPVLIADPVSTQSLQPSVEPRTKFHDRELAKSSTEPTTKNNERYSRASHRRTDADLEFSSKRHSKWNKFVRLSSSTK